MVGLSRGAGRGLSPGIGTPGALRGPRSLAEGRCSCPGRPSPLLPPPPPPGPSRPGRSLAWPPEHEDRGREPSPAVLSEWAREQQTHKLKGASWLFGPRLLGQGAPPEYFDLVTVSLRGHLPPPGSRVYFCCLLLSEREPQAKGDLLYSEPPGPPVEYVLPCPQRRKRRNWNLLRNLYLPRS